jgi:hypothetical protein
MAKKLKKIPITQLEHDRLLAEVALLYAATNIWKLQRQFPKAVQKVLDADEACTKAGLQ